MKRSLAALLLLLAPLAAAQAPAGIERQLLQRTDVGANLELIVAIATLPPGASIGRHTHFGVESGYLLAGEAEMWIEGEAPRRVKAGESYTIPAGKAHDARAVGEVPARVIASYVVEKGKPLATPAP